MLVTTPREHCPNRIRALREAKGWTQKELAERMQIVFSTVGRLETGALELTIGWMRRFADEFDCAMGDLLLEKDNPEGLSDAERYLLHLLRRAGPDATQRMIGIAELLQVLAES
jgi:transcriptional regulator with XRE-family HTH domain